jgi:hypothetical protein
VLVVPYLSSPVAAEAIIEHLRVLGQAVRIRLIEELARNGEMTGSSLADAVDERPHNASQRSTLLPRTGPDVAHLVWKATRH